MKEEITAKTVSQLSRLLAKKEVSAVEAVSAYIQRIQDLNGSLGAYITVTEKAALKQAEEVDRLRAKGESLPPLAGIPVGIKDNICTKGTPTTCASRMLEGFVPPYNAFVMDLLESQMAVMLGKLNMDEFAMGSSNETSYFGPARNPVDTKRVPGGSSGGCAAAVAAGLAAFALGSDTAGSIRQPAAFCGVVGLKPTYGAVSRRGLVALASSLDQIGPITKDVRDSTMVFEAIAKHDEQDATSARREYPPLAKTLEKGAEGLSIGLPKELFSDIISSEVKAAVKDAAERLEALGAKLDEVSLPLLKAAHSACFVISAAEASSNMGKFDGIKYGYRAENCGSIDEIYKFSRSQGFGRGVKRRILLGNLFLSAGHYQKYYSNALKIHTLIRRDFENVFEKFDLILTPTTPTTAYKLGKKRGDPLEIYMGDLCTAAANMAGLPALSLPCGTDLSGLPCGMQFIGNAFDEPLIYRAAYAYEQSEKTARRKDD